VVWFVRRQEEQAVRFAALPTTMSPLALAAAADAAAAELPVERAAPRLRALFETAAAARRRRVYVEARRLRVERLMWPGLVWSTTAADRRWNVVADQLMQSAAHNTSPVDHDTQYPPPRHVHAAGMFTGGSTPKYLGGEGCRFSFPPFPLLFPFLFPPFPLPASSALSLEVGPLNTARGSGGAL